MPKKTNDFNLKFVKKSEKDFPVTINLVHYELERQLLNIDTGGMGVLDEWLVDTPPVAKFELVSEPKVNPETDMYESCPPHNLYIRDRYINKTEVNETIKKYHKTYNFRDIETKYVLHDTSTGYMVVGYIIGSVPVKDIMSPLYKSIRQDIFIPMMAQGIFNITRAYSRPEFYDLKGYYTATVIIDKIKHKEEEYYR